MNLEKKIIGGKIIEHKQEQRNGVPVGIVAGYMATWDLDRGDDKFLKGAFLDSIAEHREKNRAVRLKKGHGETIGGFPIESVREDERGLYGVGEINLETQEGREAFSLAKQGVLSDFSVGFSIVDFEMRDGVRVISNAMLWEASIVDEPMNPQANITEVKSVVPFHDLPIAEINTEWDYSGAIKRIRDFTNSLDMPNDEYRKGFLWFDSENIIDFGSYKFPIVDVINGRMMVVPAALFSAAAIINGEKEGPEIPQLDRPGVTRNIEKYYGKMDLKSPFQKKDFYSIDQIKDLSKRELEDILVKSGIFSRRAAKSAASKLKAEPKLDNNESMNQTSENQVSGGISDELTKLLFKEINSLKSQINT